MTHDQIIRAINAALNDLARHNYGEAQSKLHLLIDQLSQPSTPRPPTPPESPNN